MPRKKPIKKLTDLRRRVEKHHRTVKRDSDEANSRPRVAALAYDRVNQYVATMQSAPADQRRVFILEMPSYETFLAKADEELKPHRTKFAQQGRARAGRKTAYRIGPLTCHGLQLPPGIRPARLPMTIDAFIEDFVGDKLASHLRARNLWNQLQRALGAIADSVELHMFQPDVDEDDKPRSDFYFFTIASNVECITFGQFQKIYTRVRRSQKMLG